MFPNRNIMFSVRKAYSYHTIFSSQYLKTSSFWKNINMKLGSTYVAFCFTAVLSVVWCGYCKQHYDTPSKESYALLKSFCSNGTLKGRECLNQDNVTIGLDISNCSDSAVDDLTKNLLNNLEWLAINDNNFTLNNTVNKLRTPSLKYVVVNNLTDVCRNFDNETHHDSVKVCFEPKNTCAKESEDTCPEHSNCGFDGPGLFTCDCYEDWQSYKCLKQKDFPFEKYLISIAVATVVLVIVMMILQHKSLKKGVEYKESARQSIW